MLGEVRVGEPVSSGDLALHPIHRTGQAPQDVLPFDVALERLGGPPWERWQGARELLIERSTLRR